MNSSWILISGCSTGMGRATALSLSAQGFRVIAGVRSEKDGAALSQADTAGRIVPVLLDVASESQIAAAVAQTRRLCGDSGLRAVINNAGLSWPGRRNTSLQPSGGANSMSTSSA